MEAQDEVVAIVRGTLRIPATVNCSEDGTCQAVIEGQLPEGVSGAEIAYETGPYTVEQTWSHIDAGRHGGVDKIVLQLRRRM